ncbi:lysozyme inhibitor LprI family protein [Pseudomonas sp. NPDC087346]|uniref:lysozyme inhibitor LprI family protein n=1 Tax=Pseudomonas sp. NPDC087346 TaxID=3364438 RepID=UPI00382BB2BA
MSAIALVFFQQAMASGMDCTKAATAVENAICADKGLYQQDAKMGAVYGKLIKSAPDQKTEIKNAQRLWLKARNQCDENVACMNQRYRERLESLQAQWIDSVAYTPDEIDKQVLEELRQRVETASKDDPEFALEKTLETLTVSVGKTSFSGDRDDSDLTHFPKNIPKGVTRDEWKALNASSIDTESEIGQNSYVLMDLDGDQRRDLMVKTYAGGTGLFTYFETFRRDGERFIKRTAAMDAESRAESALFTTNDRGANQAVNWIKMHGKLYAAYRDSSYGVDSVYLLNPLQINRMVPTLTVRYRYQLSVPRTQENQDNPVAYELEPDVQKALTEGLSKIDENNTTTSGQQKTPICPIPPSGPGDDDYYSFGASYYAIEPVADVPVILGNDCFIARLISWYGSYDAKSGLFAQLALRKPGSEEQGKAYSVNGRRHITQVSASIGKAEGGAAN